MLLQVVSDLHLEFNGDAAFTGITPAPQADALVIAGDIGAGTSVVARFAAWPVPVIYVHGNHKMYGRDLEQTVDLLRGAYEGTNVHFLEKDGLALATHREVRFLGTCLWTDYELFGKEMAAASMDACEDFLRDHAVIRLAGRRFLPADARRLHVASRDWLLKACRAPFDGKTVVISHHGPHWESVAERYRDDLVSAGFASNLASLMAGVDLWVHGHMHDSFDYRVGGTRVVVNPRGYPLRAGGHENRAFQEQRLLEV